MTPADKTGSTGQNPESEPERPSGVATDSQAQPATEAAKETPAPAGEPATPAADEPTTNITVDEEPATGSPPPWQRVSTETAAPAKPQAPPQSPPLSFTPTVPPGEQPGQRTMPVMPGPGEATVSVERPVITGAAAARLFAEGNMPTASTVGGGNRTTVHLDGSNPSAGPLRMGAAAAPSALRRPGRGPRRANLQIKRFDPWSVLKLSLVLSVALFFVWLVAVGVLYAVLNGMGVWDKLNGISSEILQPADDGGSEPLISAGRVFGVAAIIGAVNIVLFSALATVGAFIYNVSADLAGGLEVTLAERE
ncbi:DUF3566 domain-containing protein [Actinophytocola sediminis]